MRYQIFSGRYKILLLLTLMHKKARCCSINNAAGPSSPDLGWLLNGVSHTHTHTHACVMSTMLCYDCACDLKVLGLKVVVL
jgi:hypothetical protein